MNQVRLVADSSCDLLTLCGMDFVSVPLTIRTEREEFRDDAALDVDGMVRALRDTKGRSHSACPNLADWEGAFGGRGDVIAFTITSGLSGSYGVACAAKESCEERDPSRRIQVFDSLSAGPEIALLIEKAAAELLKMHPRPDAVFAVNDPAAIGMMKTLQKAGIRIPDEIAFVGFSESQSALIIEPNLTSVAQPTFEMGRVAAKLLLEQIRNYSETIGPHQSISLQGKLNIRESSQRKDQMHIQ